MSPKIFISKRVIIFLLVIILAMRGNAQTDNQSSHLTELYNKLAYLDSALFSIAYTCQPEKVGAYFTEDLEFYHDKGGVMKSREVFLETLKKNFCGETATKLRRELVKGSLQVFPMDNYGAIQTGEHRFYITENGQEKLSGTAKFTHLWQFKDNEWRITRVLSYDHAGIQPDNHTGALMNDPADIQALLKENHVPAVGIGIIRDGKLRQVMVYGELTKGVPAPYNTIFNVASLTKPVVAMLTLKLVSMGKWNLDEPLSKYWVDPDVANDPRHKKLTTRHVLSHQTGFVNWRWLHPTKKLAFDFEPGTKFQYSGEGFEYLRKALERKFHKSLQQLTDSLIFSPVGMKDTRHYWDKKMDESRFALWHDKEGNNTYTDYKGTRVSAADDLLTTVEDYGKFGVSVMNRVGLSEAVFNEMIKPQSTIKENDSMGLGWEMLTNLSNGEYALVHSGADKGVRTLVILLPKSGQGLVIMTNGDNGGNLYEKIITESLDLGKEIMQRPH